MKVFTDNGKRVGGYIISETDGATGGMRSRDTGTLAAGVVGESGLVLAQLANKKFVPLAAAAEDPATGAETAVAVLYTRANAAEADAKVVITARASEVNGAELTWPEGITSDAKAAAIESLKTKGIIVR